SKLIKRYENTLLLKTIAKIMIFSKIILIKKLILEY
ncbi:unnamed protein product, partial [marine sediment metagenome]